MKIDMQAAIRAKNVQKIYKAANGQAAKHALKGIDLTIPVGSIFGLLGPNGAGKSTFINILAGLVTKTSGTAEIWGFNIDKNPRQARGAIGVVPQELNIDPFFTPAEVMEVQAGLYAIPKKQRHTMNILAAMGLEDKAHAYARTLSGGMRRRLLVAKAMVHQPPILVLDEPTAGVDIELRKQLWDFVLDLNKKGVTIVLTTHYLEEAEELCDKIAIIDQGELIACDDTPKLLQQIDNKGLIIQPETPLREAPLIDKADCQLDTMGRLIIRYHPKQITTQYILDKLAQADIKIADLSTDGADLETVFLKLTGKKADKQA